MPTASIESFCKKASRLTLSQVVDNVVVEETLVAEDDGASRRRNFTVTMHLFPRNQYEEEYETSPKEVIHALGSAFGVVLKKEIQLELKKLNSDLKNQMANVGKGHAAPTEDRGGEDDEDDEAEGDAPDVGNQEPASKLPPRDDASENGDGDADEEKRVRQTRQQSYESDSEDEGEDPVDERQSEKGDDIGSEAPSSDSEGDGSMDGEVRVTWAERIRLAGERLADVCTFVSPGSFSFEHKSRSQCKFDLSVSSFLAHMNLLPLLTIHRSFIVFCRYSKVVARGNNRTYLRENDRSPDFKYLSMPTCQGGGS